MTMTPRRWQNLSKYFLDLSKLIVSIAVVGQLVTREVFSWKAIVFGTGTGILFFMLGFAFDWKGDEDD
jgi:hypothetical protein